MRLSMEELNQGMKGVLSSLKDKVNAIVSPKMPDAGSDESRKKLLGSGTASQAANQILDRKRANAEALKY